VARGDVLSKIQWKQQCEDIHKYSNCVTLAEIQLQGDPTNEGVQKMLSKSQAPLTKVFQIPKSRNTHHNNSLVLVWGYLLQNILQFS
jgi:phosphoribosylanthranilate isomerase